MKIEQAIQTAIEYEKRVAETYKNAMQEVESAAGKRVFEVLAKEEQGHIDYLESRLSEWRETGQLSAEALPTAVPPPEKIDEAARQLKEKLDQPQSASTAEQALLQKALVAEEETSGFYEKMVAQMEGTERELFARFLEIERGHLAIVKAEIDAVTGFGYWFDMPEWRFADG